MMATRRVSFQGMLKRVGIDTDNCYRKLLFKTSIAYVFSEDSTARVPCAVCVTLAPLVVDNLKTSVAVKALPRGGE